MIFLYYHSWKDTRIEYVIPLHSTILFWYYFIECIVYYYVLECTIYFICNHIHKNFSIFFCISFRDGGKNPKILTWFTDILPKFEKNLHNTAIHRDLPDKFTQKFYLLMLNFNSFSTNYWPLLYSNAIKMVGCKNMTENTRFVCELSAHARVSMDVWRLLYHVWRFQFSCVLVGWTND